MREHRLRGISLNWIFFLSFFCVGSIIVTNRHLALKRGATRGKEEGRWWGHRRCCKIFCQQSLSANIFPHLVLVAKRWHSGFIGEAVTIERKYSLYSTALRSRFSLLKNHLEAEHTWVKSLSLAEGHHLFLKQSKTMFCNYNECNI